MARPLVDVADMVKVFPQRAGAATPLKTSSASCELLDESFDELHGKSHVVRHLNRKGKMSPKPPGKKHLSPATTAALETRATTTDFVHFWSIHPTQICMMHGSEKHPEAKSGWEGQTAHMHLWCKRKCTKTSAEGCWPVPSHSLASCLLGLWMVGWKAHNL
jgi:hypothetical protein